MFILFLEQVYSWSLRDFPVVCVLLVLAVAASTFNETGLKVEPPVMNGTLLFHKLPNMKEVLLVGFYQPNEELNRFLLNAQQEFKISIR